VRDCAKAALGGPLRNLGVQFAVPNSVLHVAGLLCKSQGLLVRRNETQIDEQNPQMIKVALNG
jgi:hypothetical protein